MSSLPVPEACLQTALLCADAARAAIRPLFRTALAIDDKSDESPVTQADRAAETALRSLIAGRHGDHAILGEEYGLSGASCDGTGTDIAASEYVWVVDPIDGTRAFITGRPSFTTLIALFHRGRPVLGIIDQPFTQERWIGVKGRTTRFESPAMPGRVGTRSCPALDRAELSCTSPEMLVPPWGQSFRQLQTDVRRTSWGGDAYAYGLLALGQIDLIAECTMKPWDWAALVPVVEGAGGIVTDWQGKALTLESDGTVLACGDPGLHARAVERLARRNRDLPPDRTIG
ncbi:inositol monophosphatase family protein [Swaminathania salitolerans]|uniref:Histidinol-phosphatase n=1 Tax=Swaminathania salitolerans TaxID=182838 RepID=A0A511BPX5_9PROT|nr:inositol monophosphatase family protein [Swaminathania salitolerans]GBQ10706.1 inositol monophosphatase [Swaminathania salitolerans LMG 21291]GEL02142.1 histidinol-phosphatase [Swaminathania salitolerans]